MTRGRPRGFDDDQALDRAMELFWRRGYRGTTSRDLEAALGIGQSSLYNAFGSKPALLDMALDRYQERLDRELLGALHDGPGGLDTVDDFLGALAAWLVADGVRGCLIGRMMSEGDPPDPEVPRRLTAYRSTLRAALGAALARAAAAGEIPAGTVESRVDVLVGTVLGLNLAVHAGYGAAEVEGIAAGARAEVARWRDASR